jgi:serine protease Do
MKYKGIVGAAALIVIGIVFGALLVSGFGLVRPSLADIELGTSSPPVNLDANASSFSKSFIEVASKVTPAIVQIEVVSETKENPNQGFFFFFKNLPKEEKGSGSGIIISPDGYIVTNNHVVQDAKQVRVRLYDKRVFTAKVVGTDPLTDIAVIKIDANSLPTAYLGNSDSVKVGQWVMAIGNPLSLTSTVTAGIISAEGRGGLGLINNRYGVEDYLQTDAAINPGNSGGALVDLSGAVIGVNAAIAANGTDSYIGYGFAVPINLVKAVAKDLIANGKVNRGYIGVSIGDIDDATAKSLGLNKPEGVIVQSILPNGAASKEDIKSGDVILKIDGKPVNQANELQSFIASKRAGDKVTLTIFRDGKQIVRTVTLKPREQENSSTPTSNVSPENDENNESNSSATFDKLGMSVRNLTSDEKSQYNVSNGVLISDVTPFGVAEDQQLFKGAIILQADKKEINDVSDLKKIINDNRGSAILLKLQDTKGNSFFKGIEIPK